MIQNKTFVHRAVGGLLVALVALVGMQAQAQRGLDFEKSVTVPWNEEPTAATSSLQALQARITDAIGTVPSNTCFVVKHDKGVLEIPTVNKNCKSNPKADSNDGISTDPGVAVAVKSGRHVDFDPITGGAKAQTLTVTEHNSADGKVRGTLTVNIEVADHDEQPYTLDTAPDHVWYLREDESPASILVSQHFRDPEGKPVYFNTAADTLDVYICDSDSAGHTAPASSSAANNDRTAQPTTAATITEGTGGTGTGTVACSASNSAANGVPGTGGNRVISTKLVGPSLQITADQLHVDVSGTLETPNEDLNDRPKGTYTATVLFRAWSGPAGARLASIGWDKATVHVRVGANNIPQFAATGYVATLKEGTNTFAPTPADVWNAGDLDANGVNADMLEYSLVGGSAKAGPFNRPPKGAVRAEGGGWFTIANTPTGITLTGTELNYEAASSHTVELQVTDHWSDPVSVPITVTVTDVNELVYKKKADGRTNKTIGAQRMVMGETRPFNLHEYFEDPEGDEITFAAHTNIYTNVVNDPVDGMLTITGNNATADANSTVEVTVIATDAKGLTIDPMTFNVETRFKNDPPTIDVLENGTIAIGTAVQELTPNAKSGGLVTTVAYTDDDQTETDEKKLPKADLTGPTASLFKAVVNPKIGDATKVGEVGIYVADGENLDHEKTVTHELELQLIDPWNPELKSDSLNIQVTVSDNNDPPMLVDEDTKIDDQYIVVAGSKMIKTGHLFTDQDGDRLLVDASSSDMESVGVRVEGLDMVHISGLKETEEEKPVTVTLTAKDPDGAKANLMFKVKVGTNTAPVANVDAFNMRLPADNTINVGATADIELDGLFMDNDAGDMISCCTVSTSDEEVLLVVTTNDDATATLVGRASGMATLTITAMDKSGQATSMPVEITVNAAPEEATPLDMQSLDRVTPHTVDLMGVFADSDDGADSLSITAETIGEGMDRATVEVIDGMLTITGVMDIEPGDVEIKLTAIDPHGSKATSTFVATIVNVEPTVAMNVEDGQEFDRTEPLMVDLSETFGDADGSISEIVASVGEDSVVEVGDIDIADGQLTVNALAVGEATINLVATDNNGGMVETMFTVMVNNVDPVVANAVDNQMTTRIDDLVLDVSMTFSDPDDDSMLELSAMSGDDMIANVDINEEGHLMIEGLYVGTTTITLTATDVDGGMVSHDFMVEVENVSPTVAMMLTDESFDRRAPLGVDLSGTFADADGEISSLTAMVSDGSVVDAMVDGQTLTVNALAVGSSNVTVTAVDDNGSNVMTEFMVTVVNIVPVVAEAVPDQSTTRVDDVTIDISSTFDDPDQDNALLTITAEVEDGVYVETMLADNMLTISGLEVGATSVTLTAVDADGGMVQNTFMATIENVDPVVANSVPDQSMDRREPITLDLSQTFADADDGAPMISIMVDAGNIVDATMVDDSMMVTLTALNVGDTTVTLTATDANGASIMDEFTVTVVNIDPVVANAVPDQTTTRVQDVMIDISSTFNDPDFDSTALTLEVMVDDGSIVNATLSGTTLTLQGLDVGNTTVTLSAMDLDYGMVSQAFVVTIDNVAPQVAGSISPVTLEIGGQPANQAIAGLFSDDGDPLTYTISSADSGIASASISGMTAVVGAVSRGATSFTIMATDPHGGEASVTGSVTVGDGELKAVAAKSLAGFARALLASTSSSVGSRVITDAKASDLTLDAWAPMDPRESAMSMTANDRSDQAWNMVNATSGSPSNAYGPSAVAGQYGDASLSGVDALNSTVGQSFALNLGSSDSRSNWSVWGDVDRQSYEGEGYDGMASSVYLGADVTVAECWMFGVAVSSNSGESDYSWGTATQTMDLSLTTVLPYVSYQPTNRTSVWGVAGFGSGELETTVQGAANDVSDLSSQIAMVGGSQALTSVGRFDLALRGDAATASLETDNGAGAADGLAADINRIRVGLEGSFRTETGQGGMLEPFGQVNLRSDGGDGDTGTGVEIAGGVRMTSDTFTLEVQGRTLAQHGADEYSESGFSLMASLNPSATATGVSVTIAPRWGADAMGSSMFWNDSVNAGQSYGAMTGFGNFGSTASLDTQIGYGMFVGNERYLLTPFVDVGVSDDDRRQLLIGANLRQLVTGNANLDVRLALGRVEERTGASSGKVGLNATLRF